MPVEQPYGYNLQDIERYLSGSMNALEMHELERAALNDPLLADAIDGYEKADASVTAKHLNEIAALLHKTEAPVLPMPVKKNNWWRWVAAAGVMGVLGMSAWLVMRQNSPVATDILVKNEIVIPITDSQGVKNAPTGNTTVVTTDDTTIDFLADKKAVNVDFDTLSSQQRSEAIAPAAKASSSPLQKTFVENIAPATESPATQQQVTQEDLLANDVRYKSETNKALQVPVFSRKAASPAANVNSEFKKGFSFTGLVTDENGKPLSGATVMSGNIATVSNNSGKFNFSVPGINDSLNINISAIGYNKESVTIFAGRTAGIALQPNQSGMDEIVVVGYGTQKKKAPLGQFRNMKVDTLENSENPYPDGGWAEFYDELATEIGINRSKATKPLHIKFWIEDGIPMNFTVIKTPDMAVADKAITAIKKGPRWKNFRKKKSAEVKMKVE